MHEVGSCGVEALDRALDAIASVDFDGLTAEQLGAHVEDLTASLRRLDHQRHVALRRFEARGDHTVLGYVTVNQWQRDRLRCSGGDAARTSRLARDLAHLPATDERWSEGRIGADHARLLASARTERTATAFDDAEPWLAQHAVDLDHRGLSRLVQHWRLHADPDDDPVDRATEDRDAHVSATFGGTVVVDAVLDPVRGTAFRTVFDRIVDELFDHDWAEARERLERTPTVDELSRTHAQRRADALVAMALRAEHADVTAGATSLRPLVTVVAGPDALAGGLAELWDGTPLSAADLATLLRDDPSIERFLYDGDAVPIAHNPRRRLFTGRLRRAIQVRDRRCTGRGCDAPVERCQVDHVVPVAAGGQTTPDNGRLACGPCNRARPGRRFREPSDGDDDP